MDGFKYQPIHPELEYFSKKFVITLLTSARVAISSNESSCSSSATISLPRK